MFKFVFFQKPFFKASRKILMGVGNTAKCSHSNQQAKQPVINLTFCHANTETTERGKKCYNYYSLSYTGKNSRTKIILGLHTNATPQKFHAWILFKIASVHKATEDKSLCFKPRYLFSCRLSTPL